jgi:hypothetical protein
VTEVLVVKHAHDGRPPYRYPARLQTSPPGWVVVQADWPLHEVVAGPVSFKPGDTLAEFFSLERHYNAFAIHRSDGAFGGWYCNVTLPTTFEAGEIHWYDLYLDVLIAPDGSVHVEDEDELDASGLEFTDPALFATITAAKDELLEMIEQRRYPFSTVS